MVYTSTTSFSTENICLNPHSADARCVLGHLGENGIPGQAVVKDESAGLWMLADTDDTSKGIAFTRIGIIGYEKRVTDSTTQALKTITAVYTYNCAGDKLVPIWISGICICYIVDLNTNWPAGGDMMMSSTAGSLTYMQVQDTTHADSGTAVIRATVASAAIRIKDGDTRTIVGIGKSYGEIWGGWNTS